jgi:hypothetical protein
MLGSGTKRPTKRCGRMPRFYFHLRNDIDASDEEGVELPDLDAAREKARADARFSLGQTAIDEGKINFEHRIDIADEDGRILDTVWFRDVVKVEGEGR